MQTAEEAYNWYQKGVQFAHEVQEGLASGKTFDEMFGYPPERAREVRDSYKKFKGMKGYVNETMAGLYDYWDGYISQWD